jgi:hypothetical protein
MVHFDTMLSAMHAYYLKLGEGGKWAQDAIKTGKARISWTTLPLSQINAGRWSVIRKALQVEAGSVGAGTRDTNALATFCQSLEDDVWITFHASRLWWGRLKKGPVQEDSVSRYRTVAEGWHDQSVTGQPLLANQIPGSISQLQGFRGTVCRVREKETLIRLLAGERSVDFGTLVMSRNAFTANIAKAITHLHWKDFELLVDLVFRQSGWRRVSALGKTMKFVDLELEDPITGDRYQVQVKSRAAKSEAVACKTALSGAEFRRLFFVVHTPDLGLLEGPSIDDERFQVVLPQHLAAMVVDVGLAKWVADKSF